MAIQQKKKKTVLIVCAIIFGLIAVGGTIFLFARSKSSNSTSQTTDTTDKNNPDDNSQKSPKWYKKFKENTKETKNDEKSFYYTFTLEIGEYKGNLGNYEKKTWRKFVKERNGVRYELSIVANHPSLTNLSFPLGKVEDKTGRYFQIEGVNFADFTRKEMRDGPYFEKKIGLGDKDKITVKQIR